MGHSLGGIIIRGALQYLSGYERYLHSYVSLGSPHLSYMYNSSTLTNAGIWFIKNWNKSTSLKELTMDDQKAKKDTFMYKLASEKGMAGFKHVMFISSHQDAYVPHDSARV